MQTPTVEPPEPVIVSSDRLRDVGPYVERLFEEDVQKWGSILPWEFPQNASRQEEEKFLRSWFSDREIHKQGGATGDGTGYRFLKQVWYSAAIYNFETRMPQVVAWWIGKNKEDWQGTFLKNNLFREGTCAKSVFDDDEKALYSMNFLEYALRLLKHELKKFHGMREDASQTTDLDCAENSEALEEHSRSSGQSEQPAEAPLGAVEGKIAPDNNAIQGRSASINFRDVKWDNPSPLSSVQEYSTGIRARTPALYGPSPSLAPETQRSIVREESLQSKRGSKARRGSNHTDRRPIFNTHRAQPSRQLNQISVAECEGDRRNTYQAQFTHNLDAQGSAFRQFANAPSMQRGPGYDAAQYGRPMPYAMGHHVSGHTPFATQIPGHLPLMNPNSYSRAPAPPAYPVEQQPIGGYPIAYEYHNPNTQYSYSQAPSGAENERPRRYSNGSRMRGAYMNARGKPPREHVANIWPGVNYANENTLPSINASGAPSQILDWRNTGDSHPPEGASAKRWSDRSYVPQSPSSRRFKMPGNMTQGPFTHGGIMEDEYSNNTGIGKHSRRVVPELPQSQLPTKKLERGPRSQPAPCSFECKKDTIDERCQEATSIVAFDIDLDVDCEELKDRFSAFGAVRNVSKVKGIIFIEFETIEGARECLRHRYAPWSTGERLNVEVSKSHWCPGWRHQQPYSRQVYQFRPVETGEQPMNDRPEYSHVRFPVGDADVKTHARATQQSNFDGRNQLMPHPDNLKKKKKTQSKKKSSSRSDSDTPPSGEQSQQQGGAKRDSQKSSLSEHTIAGSEVGQATPETTSTAPEVVIPPTCVSTSSLESEDVTVTTGQKSVGSPVNEPKKSPSVDQEQCLGLDSKPREASPSKHNQEASPEGCSSEANASRLLNNEVIEQRPGSMLTSSDVDDSLNVIEPITPEASHVKQLPEDLAAAKAPGALSSVEPVTNNEGSNAQNELGSALSNLGLALPQENVTLAESSSPVIIEPTKTAAGLHKPLSPSNQGEIRQSVPAEASVAVPNLKLGKHVASMGHEQVLSDTGASHRSSPELAKSSEPKVMGEMQATDNQAEHKPMESITLKVSKKETKEKGPSVTESFSQFSRKNKPKAKSIKGKSSMKGKTKAEQSLANTEPLVHQAHKLESPPVSFQVKVREDGASAAPADQTEESLIAGTGQEEKDSIEVIPELFVGKQGTSKIAPAWMSNLSSIWGPKQPASASREEHVETEVEACDGDIRSGSCDIEKANTEPDQDDGITTTQEVSMSLT